MISGCDPVLVGQTGAGTGDARRDRPSADYEPALLLPVLKTIWLIGQQPCGKRLVTMMPEWAPAYEASHQTLPSSVREPLLEASPATLDRLLALSRADEGKKPTGTKPGTTGMF